MSYPRLLLALLLCLSVLPDLARTAAPPGRKAELEATVRALEKDIEKARGLTFKNPVVARIIPRPADADPGLQGYYSTKEKALYVYDDIKGNYERGVLIHEMVHALQDQHFKLDKLHQPSFGSDGELARAALVEGDASYTMIEVLKKDQPRAAMMMEVPLEKSRNLQRAFLYGQGARYVKALKEKGGWSAVNDRYRFPPSATASILHPGERIVPVDLGPGPAKGEFGLVQLLSSSPATVAESVSAAAGWRGDRTMKLDGEAGQAWVVAFAGKEQAARFHSALVKFHSAQAGTAKPLRQAPGEVVWKHDKGFLSVLTRESRVLELQAADEAGLVRLLDRVEGPPVVSVYSTRDRKSISFGEFTDRLLGADLVCVGETHDSELTHKVQLQIIKALYARDERLGVGMEMFQRPYQKYLDRYLAGAIDEATLLDDTEYRQRWGFEWSLYRPIVQFCRNNSIPLAALNLSRELTRRISTVGLAGLSAEEKKQVEGIDYHVKGHREYWYERLAKMHGEEKVPEERKEKSYQVMTSWDGYMANSAVSFVKERKVRRMVILAGSGHVDRGFGIPDRAAKGTGGKALTVHIAVGGDQEKLQADPPADFVLVVR